METLINEKDIDIPNPKEASETKEFIDYFTEALTSTAPREELKEGMNLFGQFVGAWDFDWQWMGGEVIKGEWIFSWVLDGTAIQDIWILPSREVRDDYPKSGWNYGATMRYYHPQSGSWDVIYGCSGNETVFLKPVIIEDDRIVLEAQNVSYNMRWIFLEIAENSFVWQNTRSNNGGDTWDIQGEMRLTRKNMR